MKKIAVYYISGILTLVCFVLLFISFTNHGSVESSIPLIVVTITCSMVHELTKNAPKEASEKMYYEMRDTYAAVRNQQERENSQWQHENMEQAMENTRLAAEDAMRAADNARLDNTGIEFGGRNVDPNLNPSMNYQNDSMTNMNSFNNGIGMF